jgi:hypothetical protein
MRLQPMDHSFLAYERGSKPVGFSVFTRFSTIFMKPQIV